MLELALAQKRLLLLLIYCNGLMIKSDRDDTTYICDYK